MAPPELTASARSAVPADTPRITRFPVITLEKAPPSARKPVASAQPVTNVSSTTRACRRRLPSLLLIPNAVRLPSDRVTLHAARVRRRPQHAAFVATDRTGAAEGPGPLHRHAVPAIAELPHRFVADAVLHQKVTGFGLTR